LSLEWHFAHYALQVNNLDLYVAVITPWYPCLVFIALACGSKKDNGKTPDDTPKGPGSAVKSTIERYILKHAIVFVNFLSRYARG